jgi:hypothetical protein
MKNGQVQITGFLSFISNRHGKYYSSLVALASSNEVATLNDEFVVAIMGPYNTERQAEKAGGKWMHLNQKRMKKGEGLVFPTAATVPPDVRNYITGCIVDGLGLHGVDGLGNKVFGRALQ